jgi:two-component system NarL family response regulator
MTHKIRVLVAEDHVVARVGVVTIVNAQKDMTVVAWAATGAEAVALHRQHIPDVTLLDMRMPVLSGVEAAIAIRAEFPNAKIIALTTYGGDEDIRKALSAGVRSYLTKDAPQEELLKVIRVVQSGEKYVMASLASLVQGSRPDLTPRELQVLELIVRGRVNKQIAYSLNLSLYTVANHVKTILKKLDVQDRTQAATESIRRGIIHLS